MTIAKILVPIRGDGKGEGVLEHAIAVGRRFSAHIECVYCRAPAEQMVPFGVTVPRAIAEQIRQSMEQVATGEEEHVHALFDRYSKGRGLEVVPMSETPPRDRLTLGWREERGLQADIMAMRGRLADLVVVAQPEKRTRLGVNTLHSALMNTGRPVLMCPPGGVAGDPLGHVAIAWNGSTEVARAVALGLDLIQAAERVTILSAGDTPHGASVDDLRGYLATRGIGSERLDLAPRDPIGETLLSGAAKAGASLLLMGAYSHSRGREALLGGASQEVVDAATLPVVMVH